MISVVIPYYSNKDGLAILLSLLQAQTTSPESIIVIDNSKNNEGKDICNRYSYNVPVKIFTKVGTIYQSWNEGIKFCSGDVLIINDDILLPLNCIEIFENTKKKCAALCYVPQTPSIEHCQKTITVKKFRWRASSKISCQKTAWMPGFCFLLPRTTIDSVGLFDIRFKIWYGDSDYQERLSQYGLSINYRAICRINSLYVYHFGATSYNLSSRLNQKIIESDRQKLNEKYHNPNFAQSVIQKSIKANRKFSFFWNNTQ